MNECKKESNRIKNEILKKSPTITEEMLDLLYEYIIGRFAESFDSCFYNKEE